MTRSIPPLIEAFLEMIAAERGAAKMRRARNVEFRARGTGAALVMPAVSIEAMNKHLAEISGCVSPGATALSHRVWDSYEAILDACCDAWNGLMAKSNSIASIGARQWAQVRI